MPPGWGGPQSGRECVVASAALPSHSDPMLSDPAHTGSCSLEQMCINVANEQVWRRQVLCARVLWVLNGAPRPCSSLPDLALPCLGVQLQFFFNEHVFAWQKQVCLAPPCLLSLSFSFSLSLCLSVSLFVSPRWWRTSR